MISVRLNKSRRAVACTAIACVAVAGVALMLTNSRLGVYILLDYFGDDESGVVTDPASGPLELSEFRTAVATYAMPPQIDQPSGMTYLEADNAFAIVTDQAELFVVSDDFTTVRSATALAGGLLVTRQGLMEAAGSIDGQRIAVSGETGRIDVWRKGAEPEFLPEATIELSGFTGEGEFSGIAYNPQSGEYYLSSDETLTIAVADATGRLLRELTFEDDLRGQLKPGRSLSEYELSGLDYTDGRLFAVSEAYNTLFIIDPEHGLVRALGIENGGQISAIAVRDGTAYLPLDHNYVDERPPLLTVSLD
ncbi:MAG: hypothetical protein OXQ29_23045 [Rhodospirillaceae bacterium]|nr:hypothetical protein [Rhodospirillaceae bacterium]